MERKKVLEGLAGWSCPNAEPILTTPFQRERGEPTSEATFRLYEKCIVEVDRTGKSVRKIGFCFELLFSLVRDADQMGKPTAPYGLSFEFADDLFTIYSPDMSVLREWKQVLSSKLNQKGFHRHYKPIKKIGRGSFASVYLALRLEDDRKVAIKAFSKEHCYAQQDGKEALQNEIQLMRMLNHKNLMCLYDVFESDTSVYLCVELLQGGQLYDLVKTKHKFKSIEVIGLMRGFIEGLEHMHAKRIMHRDLKPENILLRGGSNGDCVIADFGLSAWVDQPKYLYVRCGTPGYVAPQIVNIRDLSAKFEPVCDMFSVGVIFHMLVIGRSPFSGKTYNEVLTQNRACKFNFDGFEYSRLPEVTLNLLTRLLERNPRDRITAEQALKHEYFSKKFEMASIEEDNAEGFAARRVSRTPSSLCHSPLMTSADPLRKKKDQLHQDSLMKLKMQQNVITGHTDTHSSIDSGSLVRQQQFTPKLRESKFARKTVKLEPLDA